MQPYARTVSLTKVHLLNPRPEEILVEDIAFHLASIPRFNGGIRPGHYSVAEHSILLSHQFDDLTLKKYALIHDAAEYVLGDLQAPVKKLCQDFQTLMGLLETCIYQKFGLDPTEPEILHKMDKALCGAEMLCLRGQERSNEHLDGHEPLDNVSFQLWDRAKAESEWLLHFQLYWGADAEQYFLGNATSKQ